MLHPFKMAFFLVSYFSARFVIQIVFLMLFCIFSLYLFLAWAVLFRVDAVSYGHSDVINPNCQLFGETLLPMPAQAPEAQKACNIILHNSIHPKCKVIYYCHRTSDKNLPKKKVLARMAQRTICLKRTLSDCEVKDYELPR